MIWFKIVSTQTQTFCYAYLNFKECLPAFAVVLVKFNKTFFGGCINIKKYLHLTVHQMQHTLNSENGAGCLVSWMPNKYFICAAIT